MTALVTISERGGDGTVEGVHCPNCRGELGVHQPDEQWPDRLLATCRDCRCWFVVNAHWSVLCVLLPTLSLGLDLPMS